ncbi:hypothetical protein JG687_00012814, partial [Phytophthora cactorum]
MFDGWSTALCPMLLCTASSKQMAFFACSFLLCRLSTSSSMVCWMCTTRNATWSRLSSVTTAVPTSQLSLS